MQNRSGEESRPRLRVFNHKGKEIYSTTEVQDVLLSFIQVRYGDTAPRWTFYGVRLLIDDLEYNPPIHYIRRQHGDLNVTIPVEAIDAVRRDMERLLDLHEAFYG